MVNPPWLPENELRLTNAAARVPNEIFFSLFPNALSKKPPFAWVYDSEVSKGGVKMPGNGLPKEIRRLLYSFGRQVASPFSDSRRRRFLADMVPGLVISGHVHL